MVGGKHEYCYKAYELLRTPQVKVNPTQQKLG